MGGKFVECRKPMKILDFIEKKGNGNYYCYKTNKVSLDITEHDILNYDDKPASSKKSSVFAETDNRRVHTVKIDADLIKDSRPIFSYFLDGSRHVYKVDDMAIGKRIFPILAGQIIVGCCYRKDRDTFKPAKISQKLVLAMPDDFDIDDEGANFLRLYCEEINNELEKNPYIRNTSLRLNQILLYKTDGKDKYGNNSDKDNFKNRGTSIIQAEMTDEEQRMVAQLCKENKLNDETFLIKDGSLEYNPSFSNMDEGKRTMLRENYRYVVGVSKSFDPELIRDFEGQRLSKTIANLKPAERTKAYLYESDANKENYAIWYLRLRKEGENDSFRETNFSDVIKCEMVMVDETEKIDTGLIDLISANLVKEAYPVCYGNDSRWANHLYPVYLTESYCKSKYFSSDIILNLF